jgi:hypothetical protein
MVLCFLLTVSLGAACASVCQFMVYFLKGCASDSSLTAGTVTDSNDEGRRLFPNALFHHNQAQLMVSADYLQFHGGYVRHIRHLTYPHYPTRASFQLCNHC